jgi:hypothetical protein
MCHLVACLLKSEFDLTSSLALLDPACLQSADRGLDAERLKVLEHFEADRTIDPHAAERDARIAAVIEVAATAVIAPRAAVLTAVGDVKLAAARPQRSRPARSASPRCTDPRLMKLWPLALSLIRRWFLSNSAQPM